MKKAFSFRDRFCRDIYRWSALGIVAMAVAAIPSRSHLQELSTGAFLPLQTFTVTNTNFSGVGSLRQAIADANANPGLDTIVFNIPGSGVQTISFTSSATITDPVIIDGTTQA